MGSYWSYYNARRGKGDWLWREPLRLFRYCHSERSQSKDPLQDGGAGGLAGSSLHDLTLAHYSKGSFDFVASSHSRRRHCAQDDNASRALCSTAATSFFV